MPYSSVSPRVSVKPGQIIRLAESDYMYGRGEVTMRIIRVRLDISKWYDGRWVWLEGVPIRWDGTDGEPRTLLARVSALPSKGA
jgi:hypothetical protein